MNLEWTKHLTEQGAKINDNGAVTTFGNPELERFLVKNGPVLSSQSHQALLQVSGNDAFDFLQGQFTNDLKEVSAEKAQLSGYCDPKGNLLCTFLIFKQAERFILSFDASLKEVMQKRLTMFVMRSKVTITDIADSLIRIGFAGDFADLDAQRLLGSKVKEDYQTFQIEPTEDNNNSVGTIIKTPGPYHRYEIFSDSQNSQKIWTILKKNAELTNHKDWGLLDTVYGIPQLNQATQGQHLAQFFNLDKLGAINFKKGCFPGQEVIARIHYRGKVTKRMMRLHIPVEMELTPGEDLLLSGENDKTYKFNIISSNLDVLRGTLCLAITTLKPLEAAEGNLTLASGEVVTIEPLAYTLTED